MERQRPEGQLTPAEQFEKLRTNYEEVLGIWGNNVIEGTSSHQILTYVDERQSHARKQFSAVLEKVDRKTIESSGETLGRLNTLVEAKFENPDGEFIDDFLVSFPGTVKRALKIKD